MGSLHKLSGQRLIFPLRPINQSAKLGLFGRKPRACGLGLPIFGAVFGGLCFGGVACLGLTGAVEVDDFSHASRIGEYIPKGKRTCP